MEGSGEQNAGGSGHVTRKRAERIRRVEEAAARFFAERGYDRTNFDDIARDLGLRGPSLYHYFASKEEMFLACVEHSSGEVMRRLEEIARLPGPPGARLHRMFAEQVLIEIRDYPAFAPLFFKVYVPVPRLQSRVAEIKRAHGDIIREVAAECAAETGQDKEATRVALMAAFGALAYIQEWYSPDGPLTAEDLADQLAATLVAPFLDGPGAGLPAGPALQGARA
ncbi:MAG TPA: TetR/AcrR family transcriptional regulator [Streptosporangiaceae bacterium]|jgi:AcrR family transcriptional regulator|nr:TetR/AcrR family transcriptional regulator [Streptosporangiaceae bacterium]